MINDGQCVSGVPRFAIRHTPAACAFLADVLAGGPPSFCADWPKKPPAPPCLPSSPIGTPSTRRRRPGRGTLAYWQKPGSGRRPRTPVLRRFFTGRAAAGLSIRSGTIASNCPDCHLRAREGQAECRIIRGKTPVSTLTRARASDSPDSRRLQAMVSSPQPSAGSLPRPVSDALSRPPRSARRGYERRG